MANPAIRTEGLTKVYTEDTKGGLVRKRRVGVEDLNLEIKKGEVFAFLGPNGAGKTTTIKLLTRLLNPSAGRIWILGQTNDVSGSMQNVGYLPEQPVLYGYLTGREFLDFIGRLYGVQKTLRAERIKELIERVGLGSRSDSLIRGYSRGMTQRLGLAQALMSDPELLILDEPLSNLDPIGRKEVRDIILDLKKKGKSIFFSSHILSDAEMVADRVGILNQGHLVTVGDLESLDASRVSSIEVTFAMDSKKVAKLKLDPACTIIQEDRIMTQLKDENKVAGMIKEIDRAGGRIISVIPQKQSLEDYFMTEVGR